LGFEEIRERDGDQDQDDGDDDQQFDEGESATFSRAPPFGKNDFFQHLEPASSEGFSGG
jgi:hypothetical protein